MIRLFPSDATDFTTLGLGTITDAITCSVSEERNGAYGLTMEYPVDGKLFNKIELRSIIVCKPNPFDPPQAFRVHKISKNINKKVTITADHISYDMNGIVVMPFSAIGFPDIFQQLHDLAQPANPFSFDTDKSTQASYTYTVPAQLRNIIFGESGSIVANFKGEWYFNNYSAYLYDKRGTDRGVEIRYGKDLTDLKQEENCENLYTGVIPYWIDHQDDDKTWTLSGPNYAVNVADAYPDDPPVYNYTKYRVYDSTEYFSEAPNPFEEKLRARTKEIIKEEKIGIPTVSLNISIANLRKRGKNELVSQLLQIKLCDTITVVFPEMNIRTSGRVETTEYDVIRDEYTRLEIGEAKKGVVKRLLSANNKINENNTKIDSTAGKIQNAISSMTTYWISYPINDPQYPSPPPIELIEEWVQPRDSEPGYSIGNKVIYNNKVWESTISHNRNVPGTTGWTEYTGPTWSQTTPSYRDGYNIWQYTRTKYIDISTPELISGPLNLTGTKGADGKSVNILGSYNTLQELVQAHPTGNIGDAYLVNGDLYVWDPSLGGSGGWHNVGSIKGQSLVSVRKQYIKKQNTTIPSPNDPDWSYNPPEYETGYYIFTREEQTYENPSEVKYTTGVIDVTLNKFGEQLDQNEQDISLVVTDDGDGNRVINTENIVTAINAPGSTVVINADKTQITNQLLVGTAGVNGGCIKTGRIESNNPNSTAYFDLDNGILSSDYIESKGQRINISRAIDYDPIGVDGLVHEIYDSQRDKWRYNLSFIQRADDVTEAIYPRDYNTWDYWNSIIFFNTATLKSSGAPVGINFMRIQNDRLVVQTQVVSSDSSVNGYHEILDTATLNKNRIFSNQEFDGWLPQYKVEAGGTYPTKCGIYVSDNGITTSTPSTVPVGYPVDNGMHPGSRGGTLMIYGGSILASSYNYTHVLICENGATVYVAHTTTLTSPPTRWYLYEGSSVNAKT